VLVSDYNWLSRHTLNQSAPNHDARKVKETVRFQARSNTTKAEEEEGIPDDGT
jgi:hypothetical protein